MYVYVREKKRNNVWHKHNTGKTVYAVNLANMKQCHCKYLPTLHPGSKNTFPAHTKKHTLYYKLSNIFWEKRFSGCGWHLAQTTWRTPVTGSIIITSTAAPFCCVLPLLCNWSNKTKISFFSEKGYATTVAWRFIHTLSNLGEEGG